MTERPPWIDNKLANRAITKRLRADKRDPRTPIPTPDGHPMGTRICAQCGHPYPWRSYATRAGMTSSCTPCRDNPN